MVFLATGSKPAIPDLPGIDKKKVVTSSDLFLGKVRTGDIVVVMGGGLIGCEIALWLARQNKQVTLLETLPTLMSAGISVPRMNKIMLLDLLAIENVDVFTDVNIREITDAGVIIIDKKCNKKTIIAETVILALGMEQNNGLYQGLKDKVAHLYTLGDCREPKNIKHAIWDAFEVAQAV